MIKRLLTVAGVVMCAGLSSLASAYTITDIENRTVTFDQEPKRFVVANYVANFLLVAGEANLDKVVAIPGDGWEAMRKGEYRAYTKAFPELKTLPSIGGYHDDILNSEKILALKPDGLLVNRSQYQINNQRLQTLEKAGIKVV
ncbi:MAG: iron ABC transporter permease, partial [Burkholderiaceae bacterium]|nr:iron ABC transporter permease [Burkholderiaceae bacterium]